MTNPIDIIAGALWGCSADAHRLAEAAANALTDDRIVDHAVDALNRSDFGGVFAKEIVLIVLRSVGGS